MQHRQADGSPCRGRLWYVPARRPEMPRFNLVPAEGAVRPVQRGKFVWLACRCDRCKADVRVIVSTGPAAKRQEACRA